MAKVYLFTEGVEDRFQLGNKGANLVTMTKIGLPVPPGFGVTLEAYREYKKTSQLPIDDIKKALATLEKQMGRKLGQGLMVSVRSSGPVSMPGMMDTVLNVDNWDFMIECIKKVFQSADNPRAREYRRIHKISEEAAGTAALVQAMVMGNMDDRSGTGVAFTRNPSTGEKGLFGEYLRKAQGEDLVSGRRTPEPIEQTLKKDMPQVYAELEELGRRLEQHFKDMQDIEFTIESGKLYLLQTRSGKRSGAAAVKIAVDMVKEGLLTPEEAILRVTPQDLDALLHKRIDPTKTFQPITRGLNAAPGAASGKVVFDIQEAVELSKKGEKIILVRPETSPDDIVGIHAATGVLTARGGLTSHAAIVTRAMGKPCVCGASEVNIDVKGQQFRVNNHVVKKGDEITIDGTTGSVYLGALPLIEADVHGELEELLRWADERRRLGVMANADTAEMILQARRFGAEGVGLCRTERQFNEPRSLAAIREFILADSPEERSKAIERLRKLQKDDFVAILKAMGGLPIIIRLLDLPLHEFLPHEDVKDPKVRRRVEELQEVNPMMGHRGVRVGISYPELYQMQIDAILEAKKEVPGSRPSIMVPQVIANTELEFVRKMVKDSSVRVGIMVETVRAAMTSDTLGQTADFFSFGTNDLTQATLSFSREDAEKKFLYTYLDKGILPDNPFETVDQAGVGKLMDLAIRQARQVKPELEIGVCGEHGGDPRSIQFFHKIGLTYVSCSAFRIPIARLVAAQAAIQEKQQKEKAPAP